MPTFEGKIVRLACDQTSPASTLDVLTGEAPFFWRGAAAEVQCALFNGPPASGTYVSDTSNIVSVELLVRKHNPHGAVLIDDILFASDITDSSFAEWIAQTGQQFAFSLEEAFTSWEVLASGSLPIYFVITVITTTQSFVAAQGYGRIVDVGIVNVVAPFLPSGFIALAPSVNANTDIRIVRGAAVVEIIAVEGVATYIHTLSLLTTSVMPGALVDISIELPASLQPTIAIYNASIHGTLLHSVTGVSDNPTYQHVIFRYNGSTWVKFGSETI